jgi:HEPN domain-containing protein
MQHDPQRLADTMSWLTKAESDLLAAEVDLTASASLLGDAAFHCQQATEKTLKALLTWHDTPFRRTHDLAELGQQCVSIDVSLESICRRAERLTTYAWIFRYPGVAEGPARHDVEDAYTVAREVYTAIRRRLPNEDGI